MRNTALILILFILIAFTACRSVNVFDSNISKDELLYLHNKERSIKGIDVMLEMSDELNEKAQKWAEWMASSGVLEHDSLKGTGFNRVAENIAMGQKDVDEVVKAWMKSRGHRTNILNEKYTHAGFGIAESNNGRIWWCVKFGGK